MNSISAICRRSPLLKKCRHASSLVVLGAILLVSSLAFGQEGTIVGTVTDPSGSVVPNVKITLISTETGQSRTITSNEAGQYVVPDLRIGNYTIKAEAAGFKVGERKDV